MPSVSQAKRNVLHAASKLAMGQRVQVCVQCVSCVSMGQCVQEAHLEHTWCGGMQSSLQHDSAHPQAASLSLLAPPYLLQLLASLQQYADATSVALQ